MRCHLPLLLLLCAAVIGCSNTNHDLSTMNHELDVKSNPHPVQRYELTVTVDAPGPWDKITGTAIYDISNEQCIRYNDFEGVYMRPATVGRDFVLTKVGAHTYRGYFYRDALEGGDYYGKGLCHWDVVAVGPTFVVHALTFVPRVSFDTNRAQSGEALDGRTNTEWLKRKEFLDRSLTDANHYWTSLSDRDEVPGEWFSVGMATRKVDP